jgi:hypothetical protein
MLHSIAYLVSGLILFSFTTILPGTATVDEDELVLGGTVVDAESGLPVADAIVAIYGTDIADLTDNNGNFLISNLEQGTYTLEVDAEGYGIREMRIELYSDQNDLSIELQPDL